MSSFQEYLQQASQKLWPDNFNPDQLEMSEEDTYRDYERMKRMYPREARFIAAMVEDLCDRLEYEGSPMFAVYPDKVSMFAIAKKIYDKVSYKGADETLLHMIEIMVCHEFYIRRCRYRKRRKYF